MGFKYSVFYRPELVFLDEVSRHGFEYSLEQGLIEVSTRKYTKLDMNADFCKSLKEKIRAQLRVHGFCDLENIFMAGDDTRLYIRMVCTTKDKERIRKIKNCFYRALGQPFRGVVNNVKYQASKPYEYVSKKVSKILKDHSEVLCVLWGVICAIGMLAVMFLAICITIWIRGFTLSEWFELQGEYREARIERERWEAENCTKELELVGEQCRFIPYAGQVCFPSYKVKTVCPEGN